MKLIKEFAIDPYNNLDYAGRKSIQKIITYLKNYISPEERCSILDIGQRSPLTDALSETFKNAEIYNTEGDLDENTFYIPDHDYDYILYSDTIEHQFNPLITLLKLHNFMNDNTLLFIVLPSRGKLLWEKGRYHEIDYYRMQLLIQRACLKITDYQRMKARRIWYAYLLGIRPILRLFFEFSAYFVVKKESSKQPDN